MLVWALVLGIAGAVIGGFWPSVLAAPRPRHRILFSIAIGGGLGWVVGTLVGWRLCGRRPMPDTLQRSLLVIIAIAFVMMGAATVMTILGHQFGPSIDELTRHERHQLPTLAALYAVDTAIAVVTVVMLAVRGARDCHDGPSSAPRLLRVDQTRTPFGCSVRLPSRG